MKQKSDNKALVSVIMGSQSDWDTMKECCEILKQLKIPFETKIISAHRTPNRLFNYSKKVKKQGIKVIIAGAGGSAHLPGMVAAVSTLPVIGVPIKSTNSIDGWDSVLSILQMPAGVPVATVALDGAKNAGILAAEIIGTFDESVADKLEQHKNALKTKVQEMKI